MHNHIFQNLTQAIAYCREALLTYGTVQPQNHWQGIIQTEPMWELDNVYFRANMPSSPGILIEQTNPDLPWAEEHIKERLGGLPLNPGETYKIWPHYGNINSSNARFQKAEKFTHTYMERYWPKYAGEYAERKPNGVEIKNRGIRFGYGDLNDVINLLKKDPLTRQAYLPVWFPEDTGAVHGGRVPCSLGYLFSIRDNTLNIHYTIRACDFKRHFRNDIYLTVMLAFHVQNALGYMGTSTFLKMGVLTMDIINLHVFNREKNLI